ncbi:MAG TPA: hypothetical protein VGL92_12515, partial [Acidimicrobiia bacterium]
MRRFGARRLGLALAGSCTAAGVLALVYSVTLPAFALAIFFAGMLLPVRLGLLRRVVLGAAVTEVSLLAAATLLAPTGWAAHPKLLVTLLLVVAAALAGFRGRWSFRPWLAGGDAAAAILAAVALAVLAVPMVAATDGGLVHRLSFGGDTASHLNITRAVQTAQRFVYHDPPRGLSAGSETYPEGLAFTGGYTTWLVRGGSQPPPVTEFLRDMAYALAAIFAAMVFFGVLLVRELLSRRVAADKLQAAGLKAGILFAAFVTVGPGILPEAFGFQSQILAMSAILALLWVAVSVELGDHPTLVLTLLALLTMAVAHSWYLLLPIPGMVLTAFALKHRRHIARPGWAAATTLLALGTYPILNGPGTGQAVVAGAVASMPVLAVAPLALAAIALAAWWRPALHLGNAGYAYLAAAASGLLCLALAAQQILAQGPVFAPPDAYYFWKALYLLALLLAVLAAVAVAGLLSSGPRPAAWALLALTTVAWLATLNPAADYAFRHRDGPADG